MRDEYYIININEKIKIMRFLFCSTIVYLIYHENIVNAIFGVLGGVQHVQWSIELMRQENVIFILSLSLRTVFFCRLGLFFLFSVYFYALLCLNPARLRLKFWTLLPRCLRQFLCFLFVFNTFGLFREDSHPHLLFPVILFFLTFSSFSTFSTIFLSSFFATFLHFLHFLSFFHRFHYFPPISLAFFIFTVFPSISTFFSVFLFFVLIFLSTCYIVNSGTQLWCFSNAHVTITTKPL